MVRYNHPTIYCNESYHLSTMIQIKRVGGSGSRGWAPAARTTHPISRDVRAARPTTTSTVTAAVSHQISLLLLIAAKIASSRTPSRFFTSSHKNKSAAANNKQKGL